MCGIAGALDMGGGLVSPDKIKNMTKKISHRGPDDEGIFNDDSILLGHRRLSILDLSKKGHQPMEDGDGSLIIVHNGEVYNYIELKKELGQKEYKSETDTEVILNAYKKWGKDCVKKFNGIYAFAIWDKKNKTLFAARDRLGVKPLYYTVVKGVFYFASEIKSLLEAGIEAEPNNKIIYDYLVHGFYEHSEETFFKGIKQLMPGHFLKVEDGKISIERYWDLLDNISDMSKADDEEVYSRYRELVRQSVTMQMRSDVPIGINASGGLDCSILTAVVDDICGGQENFKLFSWIYGEEKYDEKPYVEKLAKYLGWSASFFALTPRKTTELIPKVLMHEEQPFPGVSIVARHYLYKSVDKDTIVFLEGHGGDEIGGGYGYYFSSFLEDIKKKYGSKRRWKELKDYAELHNLSKKEVEDFYEGGQKAYRFGGVSSDATPFVKKHCLSGDFVETGGAMPKFDAPFDSSMANMQYRDVFHTKLSRVLRSVDRNSMAYGKEVRVPFLDHKIVEFCFSLPEHQKIRGGIQRHFMRKAYESKLAQDNVMIPKRAVPDPQRDWISGSLSKWVYGILSSTSFRNREYFNQCEILKEYDSYCKRKENINSFHIWQWVNLELWFREFID